MNSSYTLCSSSGWESVDANLTLNECMCYASEPLCKLVPLPQGLPLAGPPGSSYPMASSTTYLLKQSQAPSRGPTAHHTSVFHC